MGAAAPNNNDLSIFGKPVSSISNVAIPNEETYNYFTKP